MTNDWVKVLTLPQLHEALLEMSWGLICLVEDFSIAEMSRACYGRKQHVKPQSACNECLSSSVTAVQGIPAQLGV